MQLPGLFSNAGSDWPLLRSLILVCGLIAAVPASGEVILETSVLKVEMAGGTQPRLVDASSVVSGDELQYTITFTNQGNESVEANSIVITNEIPAGTEYVQGTAAGANTDIVFSTDGELFAAPGAQSAEAAETPTRVIRWMYRPALEPAESSSVTFNVLME